MHFRNRRNLKRATSLLTLAALLFTFPAISTAQRWDNITALPLPNPFGFANPNAITTGPDGNLWFTDSSQNFVGNITTGGVVTQYFVCCGIQGITTGPDGALWFGFFDGVGRITTTGSMTLYSLPSCCGQVSAITSGPDGNLWFTEGFNNKIGRITTAGVITEFFVANSTPLGIVAGPDGNLWFTEQLNRIGRITTAGSIIEFPIPSCCGPGYITVGQDHALWFTETGPNKIGRITTKGAFTEYPLPTANSGAIGITAGTDGAIWFTEQTANKIGRITSDGSVLEYPLAGAASEPYAIAPGPDGALWFTEVTADMIGRAPACGLDLSLTFANSDLTMNFVLGTSTPSSWGTYLVRGSTLTKLWSRSIAAVDPPRDIRKVATGIPSSGSVGVFSLISTTPGGLTCYDLELVNTSAAQAAQIRKTIEDSGILNAQP